MRPDVEVLLIFRKTLPGFQSIERVFNNILKEYPGSFRVRLFMVSRVTKGLLSVFLNMVEARKQRAGVYHIAGDVHYVAAFLPKARTVLTIHDLGFLKNSSGIKRFLLKWLLLEMPIRRVGLVTTISEATRAEILKYSTCDPSKVIVIPNPVDSRIRFLPKEFCEENPSILFVGTRPNKNLERAIVALAQIPCTLIIIGKLSEAQMSLLREEKIRYEQYFNVADEEMAKFYEEADIVLFPSVFEGFGLPILEGQLAGRVVITSDIPPMSVVAGQGAIKVDPFSVEAIRRGIVGVIEQATLRRETIDKGFENIRQYSARTVATQYAEVYDRLLH